MFKDIAIDSFKAIIAWISALLLVALIGYTLAKTIHNLTNLSYIALIAGFIMLAVAFYNLKDKNTLYSEHFFIAISFAGQILILFALFEISNFFRIDVLILLLQTPLIFIFHNKIHKLLNTTFALLALYFTLLYYTHTNIGIFLILTIIITISLHLKNSAYHIVIYSCLVALAWIILATTTYHFKDLNLNSSILLNTLITLPLLYLLYKIIKHYNLDTKNQLAIYLVALFTLLLSIYIKDFQVVSTLLILGFFIGDLVIFSNAVVLTLFVISNFYYNLDTTLLIKSILLIISGIMLLIVRFIIQKRYIDG